LDADVVHQFDRNNIDTRVDLTAKVPQSPEAYKLDIGLIVNPSKVAAHTKVAIGANELIVAEVTVIEHKSGSFKFNVRSAIESHGEYKKDAGKFNADILINLIPISRKIKGKFPAVEGTNPRPPRGRFNYWPFRIL